MTLFTNISLRERERKRDKERERELIYRGRGAIDSADEHLFTVRKETTNSETRIIRSDDKLGIMENK